MLQCSEAASNEDIVCQLGVLFCSARGTQKAFLIPVGLPSPGAGVGSRVREFR